MKTIRVFCVLAGLILFVVVYTLISPLLGAKAQTLAADGSTFQVQFAQNFSPTTCPDKSPEGAFCLNVTGTADSPDLGHVTLKRVAVLDTSAKPDANGCVPASTQGTLTIQGDDVSFSATGLYCNSVTIAAYIYKVTGGTGKYSQATGSGIISVPPPVDMNKGIGTEPWSGTFR